MESSFNELVTLINASSLSIDILDRITLLIQQQTDDVLPAFLSQSLSSLLILERWVWELFSQESRTWLYVSSYQRLLQTLVLFNKNLIFTNNDIDVETKASLLFTVTIEQVNTIFHFIDSSTNDNDPFITFIGLWLDNHSHFLLHNIQYSSSIVNYIGDYITKKYVMNEQHLLYVNELRQSVLLQSIFTAKFLFYVQTCSFYLYSFAIRRVNNLSDGLKETVGHIHNSYLEIIHIHSYTVASWSKELLSCISQLLGIAVSCYLSDEEQDAKIKIIFPTEKSSCDYVEDLMRILSYKEFCKKTTSCRSTDETSLITSIFKVLVAIIYRRDIDWFFRSNSIIADTVVRIVDAGIQDDVTLSGYAILGEILTDEEWKDLKIADNICNNFVHMIEHAWNHPMKKYKEAPVIYLLKAFQVLSKNDSMQKKMAHLNKMHLLIAMCDEYPIVYDIIWALSFNQDIQQQLRSNVLFMEKLTQLYKQHENEQIHKTIDGILWNLQANRDNRPISETKKFDIMISYSHKEKALCKQIYDELTKAGYRIWIDFDQMHGNVMDAMAQAIEQSTTVIICMSEQYRKSNYCRAEAQYAFQRERKIVPILLQKHYKPDGWLLFLIGQLLYVDFNKYEFPRAMEMLLIELKIESDSKPQPEPAISKKDTNVVNAEVPVSSSSKMIEWTKPQVHDWLLEHNLVQMSRLLKDCDGRSLIYLSNYMKSFSSLRMLVLLQNDSVRILNETISLIEVACFQALMDEQESSVESACANFHKKDEVSISTKIK